MKKVLHNGFDFAYIRIGKSIYSDFLFALLLVLLPFASTAENEEKKYCTLNDFTSPVTFGDWVWNIFFNLFAHISSVKNY